MARVTCDVSHNYTIEGAHTVDVPATFKVKDMLGEEYNSCAYCLSGLIRLDIEAVNNDPDTPVFIEFSPNNDPSQMFVLKRI